VWFVRRNVFIDSNELSDLTIGHCDHGDSFGDAIGTSGGFDLRNEIACSARHSVDDRDG